MFDGMQRRIVSIWFPRLATDRALRYHPVEGPFVVSQRLNNTDFIHCLNPLAERAGLSRGMTLADARAFCPPLVSVSADQAGEHRLLCALRRWALRYCPWVGLEEPDGLVLDITGSAHLAGGEGRLLSDMRERLGGAGFDLRMGLGDTRGAAWALAHYGEGLAAPGNTLAALADLPVAALRISEEHSVSLQRLGLGRIGVLAGAPRAPLARRFGPELLDLLDRALGQQAEAVNPLAEPPHFAVRLTLPEPIGRTEDVMAGLFRLLDRLCDKLRGQEAGARELRLTLRRVDGNAVHVDLRLAAAMRDAGRIQPLFTRGVEGVNAGFGIDQLRLEATLVEPLPLQQIGERTAATDRLNALVTRIGARIGLENILCFRPVDSHIPERSFALVPFTEAPPMQEPWPEPPRPRPLILFPPEPILASGSTPPETFRWRGLCLTTGRATGPERIAPEWWVEDENWRSGVRDYWRVETLEGRRLWLFHTPQAPGWFVQGIFS
ncbi:Y-family DNA polymerase [Haematobacter missouriensis]|uniref:DNA-directed DNA polymerase n=1 Tax=Haematobacter missouriensis TaxID=366616 RepID=A0A212ATZ2_9RHOB|nr:DNA polymerase Y family protein [Haematobacter missouriensis]OWJ74559.1 nucleotidyltransferase [Haematobacter missouriensis]OWJ84905.1 nucleotidyltransferase [Haematobacter missouriensis]